MTTGLKLQRGAIYKWRIRRNALRLLTPYHGKPYCSRSGEHGSRRRHARRIARAGDSLTARHYPTEIRSYPPIAAFNLGITRSAIKVIERCARLVG